MMMLVTGRTKIADGTWGAPTTCVLDGVVIGEQALVRIGAVVTKNVDDHDVERGFQQDPSRKLKSKEVLHD